MGRALQALVNAKALEHNLNVVRNIAPNSKVIAMVKADAYGHGMLPAAKALHSADAFGVACIEEAIALRRANIAKPIVLMQGFYTISELHDIMSNKFEVVIHNIEQLNLLDKIKKFVYPVTIWLKINTGMNRLGLTTLEAKQAYQKLRDNSNFFIKGIMTHFACSDELDSDFTIRQIQTFNDFCNINIDNKISRSMANSAAVLKWPQSHVDWVRPGLMLYGISPFNNISAAELNLMPAMSLETEIISVIDVKQGESIGYNRKFIAPKDMLVGIIAVGYADGLGSSYGVTGFVPVSINGVKLPFIGKVSMDMAAIDLSGVSKDKIKIGSKVILWGSDLPVEDVARSLSYTPYELVTRLGNRVSKKYIR